MTGGLARCFKSFFALCMWHQIQCHDLQSWPCSTDRTNQIKGGCIHVGKERKQQRNILSVMLDWTPKEQKVWTPVMKKKNL
jgi:hypothetical protein